MLDVMLYLRDRSPDVVAAWRQHFEGVRNVDTSQGDIFAADAPPADAIVSPANSFGYMDGGIDAVYRQRFGPEVVVRLQTVIKAAWDGELPVGCAAIVETGDAAIPYLVSAPTMRVPMDVSETVNGYLAFRAALIAVREANRRRPGMIRSVLCPGLCTFYGHMSPDKSARQMRFAHRLIADGQTSLMDQPGKILHIHRELVAGK
jgi:O-acetyl-ADP-ribose deacetylase (regulator of RNase III)